MSYGMTSHVGVSFQTAFGTSNQDSMTYISIISESLTESIPDLLSESLRGRFEESGSYEGQHEYAGDLVLDCSNLTVGKFLKAWFGQSSGTLVDSHYTHEFNPVTSDFSNTAAVVPMSIEVYRDAGSAQLYSDMLCNQLVLEFAGGTLVKTTASMIGANRTAIAKTTPSYSTDSAWTWDEGSFSWQGSNNGALDELQSLTITLNNNLEATGTLNGTKRPSRIKRTGFRTVEVAGSLLFENDEEFNHFLNSVQQPIVINLSGQSVGDTNATLTIDIPEFRYTEFSNPVGGPGLISASFSGKAKYSEGSGTMITVTLVNTMTAY